MSKAESPTPRVMQNRHPNAAFRTFATVIVIGIGTFVPSALFLAPNLEQDRTEARYCQDRHVCRQLTLELQEQSPLDRVRGRQTVQRLDELTTVVELENIDTWGTPYRAVFKGADFQIVRVFSCGVDQVSTSAGLDFDDMSQGLAETYLDRAHQQRQRQWLIALAAWIATWALFSGGALAYERSGT